MTLQSVNCKYSAFAWFALRGDAPAVLFYDAMDIIQSEAVTLHIVKIAGVGAIELLEYMFQVGW